MNSFIISWKNCVGLKRITSISLCRSVVFLPSFSISSKISSTFFYDSIFILTLTSCMAISSFFAASSPSPFSCAISLCSSSSSRLYCARKLSWTMRMATELVAGSSLRSSE